MPRIHYRTLYKDPKLKITHYPEHAPEEPEHTLEILDSSIRLHHYGLKEGALARMAKVSDKPCEVRRVLDLQCKHIFTYLLGIRVNAQAFSGIVKQAYEKQEALMTRSKRKARV